MYSAEIASMASSAAARRSRSSPWSTRRSRWAAATASKIDPATAQPQVPANLFKVGDTIFLTYSVHPKSAGIVTANWYTNNNFYQKSTSTSIKDASSGYFPMQYLQPAEGRVELYWNNQLAITLYFVVEPGQP
jgi:hypothetical protein